MTTLASDVVQKRIAVVLTDDVPDSIAYLLKGWTHHRKGIGTYVYASAVDHDGAFFMLDFDLGPGEKPSAGTFQVRLPIQYVVAYVSGSGLKRLGFA